MKKVVIYKGSKTPTQSGGFKTKFWYLKFTEYFNYEEDLMTGWKGGISPKSKIKIKFSSLDSAIAYAQRENFSYEIITKTKKKIVTKTYADNFKFNRNKSDID